MALGDSPKRSMAGARSRRAAASSGTYVRSSPGPIRALTEAWASRDEWDAGAFEDPDAPESEDPENRRSWAIRASRTRASTVAEQGPSGSPVSSSRETAEVSTWRSIRSLRGPEIRFR